MNIVDLIYNVRKDLVNLQQVLDTVRNNILSNSKSEVLLKGKTVRQANIEQPALFGYYDEIRVHLKTLSDYMEIRINESKAKTLKMISEQSSIEYGERLREKLVDEDPTYIEYKLKKLEVDEVLELTKSICTQFESRGYALANISKCLAAQAQDEHIYL